MKLKLLKGSYYFNYWLYNFYI